MTEKKLAIVTGGIRGIGGAIARILQKNGYDVVSGYSTDDDVANKFSASTSIKTMKWNVGDYDQCITSVQKIEGDFGKTVSILVNNAGITRDAMLHKSSKQQWDEVVSTNLSSCYNMSFATIKQMRERNFGRIVNISSINGLSGQFGQTAYAATKSGIIGFSKSLALESALKGITVNVVAPGYTDTDMTARVNPVIMEAIVQKIPVKRLGHPDEIARGVLFLVSDEASFITGQVLSINGGQYM